MIKILKQINFRGYKLNGCLFLFGIEVIFFFTYVVLYMKRENRFILGFVED